MLTSCRRLVIKTHCFGYKNAVIRLVQGDCWTDTSRRHSKHRQTILLDEHGGTKSKLFLEYHRYQGVDRRSSRYISNATET